MTIPKKQFLSVFCFLMCCTGGLLVFAEPEAIRQIKPEASVLPAASEQKEKSFPENQVPVGGQLNNPVTAPTVLLEEAPVGNAASIGQSPSVSVSGHALDATAPRLQNPYGINISRIPEVPEPTGLILLGTGLLGLAMRMRRRPDKGE